MIKLLYRFHNIFFSEIIQVNLCDVIALNPFHGLYRTHGDIANEVHHTFKHMYGAMRSFLET